MGKSKISTQNVALESLVQAARRARAQAGLIEGIPDYALLDASEIYDYLMITWADHKGNAAVVYGSVGSTVTQSVGFNAGMFILPGFLNLTVSATFEQTYTNDLFLMIHRLMPRYYIHRESRESLHPKVLYKTEKPVCLMAMEGFGQEHSGKLAVSFSVGVDTGKAMPFGKLGFTLGGADVSIEIGVKSFKYIDNFHGVYPHGADQVLRDDFANHLGVRHTHYLKREIVKWLKDVKKEIGDNLSANAYAELREAFKKLPGFNNPIPGFKPSSERVGRKMEEILAALENLPDSRQRNWTEQLAEYERQLTQAMSQQADFIRPEKQGVIPLALRVEGLCFLTLANYKKTGTFKFNVLNSPADGVTGGSLAGSTSALAQPLAPNATEQQADWLSAGIPMITFGAGVRFQYKSVNTNYRYQSYVPSGTRNPRRLVMTQDVTIKYTEYDATLGIQAGLDLMVGREVDLSDVHVSGEKIDKLKKVKAKALKGKKWGKRSMVYKAATAFWCYEDVVPGDGGMNLLYGSGLSFGMSLSMRKILKLAYAIKAGVLTEKDTKTIKSYADQIRVTPEEFTAFLNSLLVGPEEEADKITGFQGCMEAGVVLVEASFRLYEARKVKRGLDEKGQKSSLQPMDLTQSDIWSGFFHGKDTNPNNSRLSLESIRIRVRIGDSLDNGTTRFRLGLYLFGTGYSFQLDKVESAGNEGILTVHTYYFEEFDQQDSRVGESLENGVPPVTLVPHHFIT